MHARPHAVGAAVGADGLGLGEHDVQVHRGQEEQRKPGDHLPPPQCRVAVVHVVLVVGKGAVLAVADGELAHRQHGVADEQHNDHRHHDDTSQGMARPKTW
jgi:hypothetical protein